MHYSIQETKVSLALVVSYGGWALAVGVWIVSWIVGSSHLGQGALLVALAAAVSSARISANERARELHNAMTIMRSVDAPTPLQRR